MLRLWLRFLAKRSHVAVAVVVVVFLAEKRREKHSPVAIPNGRSLISRFRHEDDERKPQFKIIKITSHTLGPDGIRDF